ncbi:hypothetical protein WMY93_031776 [Mugilogobius chulae]|uniref:Rhombotin-2 n=1 Tax=Mugilogobius chulae TaxID=88201 RepID=A0AAW0ME00_9GOBI
MRSKNILTCKINGVFPENSGRGAADAPLPPHLWGCQQSIGDRFFLKAIEQYWHEDCLSCDLCGCRLGEVGRRLYYKLGRNSAGETTSGSDRLRQFTHREL